MAIKKSDLYSSLWASCDALRGGMDASQYKDYVLVMLFLKYVSDIQDLNHHTNCNSMVESLPPLNPTIQGLLLSSSKYCS